MYILGILIGLIIVIAVIIAYWRIFERAGMPGWYALVGPIGSFILGLIGGRSSSILFIILSFAFMSFNMFILARISGKLKNFWYYSGGLILGIILLYFNKAIILQVVLYIFAFVQIIIISYGLAQSFGRRKSASVLFALTPGINYFVLGFSNDEYIGNKGATYISNNGINSNISSDANIIMQDGPELRIEPVDPSVNSMNGIGVNLNNINLNSADSNSVKDLNSVEEGNNVEEGSIDLQNINIDELTPIGAMERPTHDDNPNNL